MAFNNNTNITSEPPTKSNIPDIPLAGTTTYNDLGSSSKSLLYLLPSTTNAKVSYLSHHPVSTQVIHSTTEQVQVQHYYPQQKRNLILIVGRRLVLPPRTHYIITNSG